MGVIDYDNFNWRKLQRNGYCSTCGEGIVKDTKEVLTFKNKKAHYDLVILCPRCCERLIKTVNLGEKR